MKRSLTGIIKTVLFAILVGLVLVSMAMWGVSDAFTPSSRDAAAMIGKDKVRLVDFDREFRNRLRTENRARENRITTKQAHAEGLHRTVLNQMINRTLLGLDAADLGVDVNSRDALDFVESLDGFNNEITGKYDKRKLAEILARQNNGTTVKQFEKDVYNELRLNQTISGMTTGIVAPPEFGTQQYKFMTEQRKVRLLEINRNAVVAPPDPSDEDLKAYIDKDPRAFIAPEYRRFTLIRVELTDILPDIEATEEDIADLFDYKIKAGQLGAPERRSIVQFISSDEEKANAITAALNSGLDAAQVQADMQLEDPIIYTDILVSETTVPVVGEIGFKLEQGAAETATELGSWYSIQATGIIPEDVPDLETQRESLIDEIKQRNAENKIYDLNSEIATALEEGATLEEVATANKASIASYDFVSRLGQNEAGEALTGLNQIIGIAGDDEILTEIFTSEPGYNGDVFDTKAKGFAAVRVDEIKASAQRPYEGIRELALEKWHLEQADKELGTLSEALLKRANDGETLETIASEYEDGVSVREVIMMRAARTEGLSGPLTVQIFDGRQGQFIRGLAANGLDRVVAQIDTIVPNADVLVGGVADSFKEQAKERLGEDIQQAYRKALLEKYPAQTIDENIEQILGINSQ